MGKPFLSIGMIVKNEIRCIERCLKALQPLRDALPCELVIADTGSTDGTREVAAQYADQLIDFVWVNDFAAARNAVMERCSGRWYFTVDADEYLDPDIRQLVQLSKMSPQRWPDTLFINQRNYNSPDLEHGEYMDFLANRLARLELGFRYEGRIHEYFVKKNGTPTTKIAYLSEITLHHDGYALESPDAKEAKLRRNLELLDQELDQNPEDLHRLNQCMESSFLFPARAASYAVRSMAILTRPGWATDASLSAPGLAGHCAMMAAAQGLPQAKSWISWSLEHYPDHVATRIDTTYAACLYAYQKEQYEDIPALAERFTQDSQRLHNKQFPLGELSVVSLGAGGIGFARKVECIWAVSLHKLGQREEGLAHLLNWPLEKLPASTVDDWVKALAWYSDRPEAAEEMCRALALIPLHREENDASSWETAQSEQLRKNCLMLFLQDFEQSSGIKQPWRLFLGAEGVFGSAARILASNNPTEAEEALANVDKWEDVPPIVLERAFALGAKFPSCMYALKAGLLRNIVSTLAVGIDFPRKALAWINRNPPSSLAEKQFVWQVLAACMQKKESFTKQRQGQELCEAFGHITKSYYENFYHPNVLADPNCWEVFPKMGRFCMHYLQALECRDQNDLLGYVQHLRAGLAEAPLMKPMVSFLTDHIETEPAPIAPELLQLAQQVRAILSQYAPDDPAVVALKQSPVYQRVAHLLEAPSSSGADNSTISPALLEEALAGSRKEIAASICKNIERWGVHHAKSRVDYWEKYPLWGKDKDEVVDNLSAAFSSHGADFRWLFDRLGDEQSRRILTAVVRSWRFFEIEPLGQVIDQTYDDYFDLSLLHCDESEVVADLGAFTGDTFSSYVKNYGSMAYRRYYAYEITKNSFDALEKVTAPYPRVVLRRKGAGDGSGVMALDVGADASANTLTTGENAAETVEIVALDDDITEPLTLIKMDIEGAEQSALRGCTRHIREDRPKLALSVYHNFEDLWKLPRMIEEMAPGYRFYLRYHGGNLWPSEITLLALPEQR